MNIIQAKDVTKLWWIHLMLQTITTINRRRRKKNIHAKCETQIQPKLSIHQVQENGEMYTMANENWAQNKTTASVPQEIVNKRKSLCAPNAER